MTDAPCTHFAKELIEAYPEAKVILQVRGICCENILSRPMLTCSRLTFFVATVVQGIDRDVGVMSRLGYKGALTNSSSWYEHDAFPTWNPLLRLVRFLTPWTAIDELFLNVISGLSHILQHANASSPATSLAGRSVHGRLLRADLSRPQQASQAYGRRG